MSEATIPQDVPDSEAAALAASAPPPAGVAAPAVEPVAGLTAEDVGTAVPEVGGFAANDDDPMPVMPEFDASGAEVAPVPAAAPGARPEAPAPPAPGTPAAPVAATPSPAAPAPEPVVTPEVPQKAPWDKTRQRQDQALANVQRENTQLLQRVAELEAGGARSLETISAELSALQATPLDELAEDDAKAARQSEFERLTAELGQATVFSQQQGFAAENDQVALDRVLNKVCAEQGIGEANRNAIVAGLNTVWADRGYGPSNCPDALHVEDLARGLGLEAARVAAAAPAVVPAPSAAAPVAQSAPDTGVTAPAPPVAQPPSGPVRQARDCEEAEQHMRGEGLL